MSIRYVPEGALIIFMPLDRREGLREQESALSHDSKNTCELLSVWLLVDCRVRMDLSIIRSWQGKCRALRMCSRLAWVVEFCKIYLPFMSSTRRS